MAAAGADASSSPARPLIHMVWFKWRADATPAAIDAALNALLALRGVVPGVLELSVGVNTTARSKGYTHGLLVKLATAEDLPRYADHPAHLAVVKDHIAALKDDVIAMDYVENAW
jgi:hypothetical protein